MSIARYQAYLIPVDFFPSRCRGTPKSSILGAKYCATGLCIIFLACIKQFSHLPVHLSIMVNLHSSAIYHLQMYQQVFRGHVPILSLITIYSRSPHLSLSTANGPVSNTFPYKYFILWETSAVASYNRTKDAPPSDSISARCCIETVSGFTYLFQVSIGTITS